MSLKLMYITNNPAIALTAEKNGVDQIFVDLETLGKEERQKNMNTVKSHHTINDVAALSKVLHKSELMVRINPWNENSEEEIEQVIASGADRIMLPMWKSPNVANKFLKAVNNRVATTLLLETKEAADCIDEVLNNPLLDEIHIGLNDLHLSYGLDFMFQLLSNGTVENLCKKMQAKQMKYGFGGIAGIGEGAIPAERIITEHYRLGSQRAILSRSFCDVDKEVDLKKIEKIFAVNIKKIREFENNLSKYTDSDFEKNKLETYALINDYANSVKKDSNNEN